MIKRIFIWVRQYIKTYKRRKDFKKRLEELKKRDPFTYKH